jgi:hypothetical protein
MQLQLRRALEHLLTTPGEREGVHTVPLNAEVHMKASSAVLLATALLAACDSSTTPASIDTAEPDGETIVSSENWYTPWRSVAAPIRIYQQNVYVGTDVDAVTRRCSLAH